VCFEGTFAVFQTHLPLPPAPAPSSSSSSSSPTPAMSSLLPALLPPTTFFNSFYRFRSIFFHFLTSCRARTQSLPY